MAKGQAVKDAKSRIAAFGFECKTKPFEVLNLKGLLALKLASSPII